MNDQNLDKQLVECEEEKNNDEQMDQKKAGEMEMVKARRKEKEKENENERKQEQEKRLTDHLNDWRIKVKNSLEK
jgi:hypothetical protein